MLSARQGQHAAFMEPRIDVLFTTDPAHLVHRSTHRQQQIARSLGPEALFQTCSCYRKIRGTPAAVAPEAPNPVISFSTTATRSAGS